MRDEGIVTSGVDATTSPATSAEVLESRMEYILQFLEAAQAGKIDVSGDRYQQVFDKLKATFQWKNDAHSQEELQTKIRELDTFMTDVCKNIF